MPTLVSNFQSEKYMESKILTLLCQGNILGESEAAECLHYYLGLIYVLS